MRYCSRAHTVSVKCLVIERHVHVWAIKTWLLKCQETHKMLSSDKTVLQDVWELTTHLFIYLFIHCIMSAFDESVWLHVTWQPCVAVEGRLVASVWVQTNDRSREDAGWAVFLESLSTQSKWLCVYCPGQWIVRGAATVVVCTWPHLLTAKARWHCVIVTPTLKDEWPLPMPSRR